MKKEKKPSVPREKGLQDDLDLKNLVHPEIL